MEREKEVERIKLEREAAIAEYERRVEQEKLEREASLMEMRKEQERIAHERAAKLTGDESLGFAGQEPQDQDTKETPW